MKHKRKITFQWIPIAAAVKSFAFLFEVLWHPLISSLLLFECFWHAFFFIKHQFSLLCVWQGQREIDECHKSLLVIRAPDNDCYYSIQSKSFGKNMLGKIFHVNLHDFSTEFRISAKRFLWNFNWSPLHSFIATHSTRQKWFDDAQIKLIHLEIDRSPQGIKSSFPEFINKKHTRLAFWMLAIKLSIAKKRSVKEELRFFGRFMDFLPPFTTPTSVTRFDERVFYGSSWKRRE